MAQEAKTEAGNMTAAWLVNNDKTYLANAALRGAISYLTALQSAIDPRHLSERLSAWDRDRSKWN